MDWTTKKQNQQPSSVINKKLTTLNTTLLSQYLIQSKTTRFILVKAANNNLKCYLSTIPQTRKVPSQILTEKLNMHEIKL